jgi:hypothetical protein
MSSLRPMTPPMSPLDPAVMLATSIHAQPGVYALLLGSGVSTGAGIPTGWGVVRELVRRAAAAAAPDDPAAAERAAATPEEWWAEHGDGEPLGYSNLLGALASEPAARRGLLAGFFEPSTEDLAEGLKVPGPGHRAIADLVRRGLVRVIITTNFDRLIEKALEDVGVSPQIVSRPEAVSALTPLAHAPATVIKIHGDYADLDMRNTIEELDTYPQEWTNVLQRIFDEYGLLISGWSADWDKALVRLLEEVKPRRYPLFWDSRSSRGEAARRILSLHRGSMITATSADDLFRRLVDSIDALDRLSEAPLTTALAVARLKRFLPDPLRRIDLHDLVMDKVAQAADHASRQTVHAGAVTGEFMETILGQGLADLTPVLHLLTTGVAFDRDGTETDLWVSAIRRLMQARGPITTVFIEMLDYARHYPALLALRATGLAALHAGRDDVLLRLLLEPKYRDRQNTREPIPAVQALHEHRVLDDNAVRAMPRWGHQRPLYPASHLLRADLREIFRPLLPDDADYKALNDQFEFRTALVLEATQDVPGAYRAASGEYVGEWQWLDDGRLRAEAEFVAVAGEADDSWPWWHYVGGPSAMTENLNALREILRGYVRYRWR